MVAWAAGGRLDGLGAVSGSDDNALAEAILNLHKT